MLLIFGTETLSAHITKNMLVYGWDLYIITIYTAEVQMQLEIKFILLQSGKIYSGQLLIRK